MLSYYYPFHLPSKPKQCDVVKQCEGPCSRMLCDGCLDVDTCGECGKSFCEECRNIFFCEGCDEWFCTSCRELMCCDFCYEGFCSTCFSEPLDCSKCERIFCGWCEKDVLRACDACDCLVCDKCDVSPTPCGGCNGLFCCRDLSEKCTTCLEQYCSECAPQGFDPCNLCEKCPTCCTDVSWCSQCEQSFGKECREVYECRGRFTCTQYVLMSFPLGSYRPFLMQSSYVNFCNPRSFDPPSTTYCIHCIGTHTYL